MTVRTILTYPNPVLREVAAPVTPEMLHSSEIQTLISDMVETLYHFPGTVGLAAAQVGVPVSVFVMDSTAKTTRSRLFVCINPVIEEQSQWKYSREGCLSFPDYLVTVKRARKMTVSWLTPAGEAQTEQLRDFEAIIFQHELDHLQGILFIDRVRDIQSDIMLRTETVTP